MAEKIIIDIYKNKNPDELSKLLADKESRLEMNLPVAGVKKRASCFSAVLAMEPRATGSPQFLPSWLT